MVCEESGRKLIWCEFDCDLCMMEGRPCVKFSEGKKVDSECFNYDPDLDFVDQGFFDACICF